MVDPISAVSLVLEVTTLIETVYEKYREVKGLKDEVKQFRRILLAVKHVLLDVRTQLENDQLQNTSLRESINILRHAVTMADEVLEKCTRTDTRMCLKQFCFTKFYLKKLAASTSEMDRALSLLSAAGVVMQADVCDGIEDVKDKVSDLKEMADKPHDEVLEKLQQQSTQLDAIQELIQKGVVNSQEDYIMELQEIKCETEAKIKQQTGANAKEKEDIGDLKETLDQQILQLVEKLSLNDEKVDAAAPVQSISRLELLKCCLSQDIMEDPVLVHQSEITYDKKWICESLMRDPYLDPFTGVRYDSPLTYSDNVFARQQLIELKGRAGYKKYDDTQFKMQYKKKWQELVDQHQQIETAVQLQHMNQHQQAITADHFQAKYNSNVEQHMNQHLQTNAANQPQHENHHQQTNAADQFQVRDSARLQQHRSQQLQTNNADQPQHVNQHQQTNAVDQFQVEDSARSQQYLNQQPQTTSTDQPSLIILYTKIGQHCTSGSPMKCDKALELAMAQPDNPVCLGFAAVLLSPNCQEHPCTQKNAAAAKTMAQKALDFGLEDQAKKGGAWQQFVAGLLQEKCEKNYESAVDWYRKAAKQSNIAAQNNLGLMYKRGRGVEQNDALAVDWYRKAAKQGHAVAQNNLGLMYQYGRGEEQNHALASEWYHKAATQGNVLGQFNLGVMYRNGRGVEQNDTLAMEWFRHAAEQGDAGAQCNLGVMYEICQGTDQNDALAVQWYRKAAEQGLASAQYNLGVQYEMGRCGFWWRRSLAVEWYRKAAERGNACAQYSLGHMYQNGRGVENSHSLAMEWFEKAANQRHASAKSMLHRIKAQTKR